MQLWELGNKLDMKMVVQLGKVNQHNGNVEDATSL
jgi:hypothetical protein